jgi:hypothetical protein
MSYDGNGTRAWGFQYANGPLGELAFRTRQEVMRWAAQRMVSADDYRNRSLSVNWRHIKKRGCKIVRVRIYGE